MTITAPPPIPEVGVPPVPPPPVEPNGAAAAALLAGGIGCAFFGLLVLLNEVSPWLDGKLTLSHAVGPLSGTTTLGVAGWLAAWLGLHRRLRGRDVPMAPTVRAARILVGAGFVLTFPPFYRLFTG